jgi:hypothetical protein
MRFVIAATAAVLTMSLAAALNVSPATAAQKKKAVAQMSEAQCIELAKRRGYSRDIQGGAASPAHNFIVRCMQGTRARAQR